jgi:hypothetical protein
MRTKQQIHYERIIQSLKTIRIFSQDKGYSLEAHTFKAIHDEATEALIFYDSPDNAT